MQIIKLLLSRFIALSLFFFFIRILSCCSPEVLRAIDYRNPGVLREKIKAHAAVSGRAAVDIT